MTTPPESTAARLARIRAAVTNGLGLTYGDAAFLLSQLHAAERERNDALRALGIGSNGQWGAVASEAAYEAAKRAMADEPSPAAGLMAALNAGLAQTLREHEERVAEARKRAWEAEHRAEVTLVELAAYKAETEWLARQHDTAVAALNKALEDAQRLQGERDEARGIHQRELAQVQRERDEARDNRDIIKHERDRLAARVGELEADRDRMQLALAAKDDGARLCARIATLEGLLERTVGLLHDTTSRPFGDLRRAIEAALSAPAQPEARRWPTVDAFTAVMRAKLDANADKGGWDYEDQTWLLDRLDEESKELRAAYGDSPATGKGIAAWRKRIADEAADVANFAMMVADVCGALAPQSAAAEANPQAPTPPEPRRDPMEHELKCWRRRFAAIRDGVKTFEWRRADRDYRVGDTLLLREWSTDEGEYTGREMRKRVTHVLRSGFGMPDGYCVMALADVEPEARRDERPEVGSAWAPSSDPNHVMVVTSHIEPRSFLWRELVNGKECEPLPIGRVTVASLERAGWSRVDVPAPHPAPDTRVCPDCGKDAPRSRLGGYACACGRTFAGSMLGPQPASAEAGAVEDIATLRCAAVILRERAKSGACSEVDMLNDAADVCDNESDHVAESPSPHKPTAPAQAERAGACECTVCCPTGPRCCEYCQHVAPGADRLTAGQLRDWASLNEAWMRGPADVSWTAFLRAEAERRERGEGGSG